MRRIVVDQTNDQFRIDLAFSSDERLSNSRATRGAYTFDQPLSPLSCPVSFSLRFRAMSPVPSQARASVAGSIELSWEEKVLKRTRVLENDAWFSRPISCLSEVTAIPRELSEFRGRFFGPLPLY